MSSPLSGSQPSAPVVSPLEHAGVRYEQDIERQRRTDALRGGWLVATDVRHGNRLWEVQVYANPYDAGSPAGSPARWFARMQLVTGGDRLEIEDIAGARYEVDLVTHAVTQTLAPPTSRASRPDNRPAFD